MGHANLANISDFFIKRLYAKGKLSIKECVDAMVKAKLTLNASEAAYEEPYMLSMGCEEVLQFLRSYDKGDYILHGGAKNIGDRPESPVVIPVSLSKDQKRVLAQWDVGEIGDWDCGDDGSGGDYGLFDSIQWKFAKGWRNMYPDIPRLGNVTH